MDTLVSIVVMTYNHENFIKQALDGILIQEVNFKYEIVIGEDCSTDETREIVFNYAKKYPDIIKVVTSQENVGVNQNARRAVSATNGKYIAFCEGDDYWHDKYKLQNQVDFLESNKDYGMVHTDADHFIQKSKRLIKNYNRTNNIIFPSGEIFEDLLGGFYFIKTASVLVRSGIFKAAFDVDLIEKNGWLVHDNMLWLKISHQTKLQYLDCSTATYRLLDESASRSSDLIKNHLFHLSVYDIKYYYWEKYSKKNHIKKKLDKYYHEMILGDAFRMGDKELAEKAYSYLKDLNLKLPIKHKAKYWSFKSKVVRFLYNLALKMKRNAI